ncbi:MAG TPA: hypothetical protein VM260_10555 [Pirellula sp.]|nr:hypothetical protein [Pirellula sp.]
MVVETLEWHVTLPLCVPVLAMDRQEAVDSDFELNRPGRCVAGGLYERVFSRKILLSSARLLSTHHTPASVAAQKILQSSLPQGFTSRDPSGTQVVCPTQINARTSA